MAELAMCGVFICGLFIALLWQRVAGHLKILTAITKTVMATSDLATEVSKEQVAKRGDGPAGPRIRGAGSSWPPKPGEKSKWDVPAPKQTRREAVKDLVKHYAAARSERDTALVRHDIATERGQRAEATQWYGRHQRASAATMRLDSRLNTLGWDAIDGKWIREPEDEEPAATPAAEQ